MTTTIAIAGKGGTGKTTIAALLVRYLKEHKPGASILAIDADPASNLNAALGLPLEETVGDIREDTAGRVSTGRMEAGIAKQDYLDLAINQALVEGDGVDLLAMGRPEGPGCYCAANNMLRSIVDRIAKSYDYVVIDNEAGLEHLSRRTTRDVDVLLIVSDPTVRGLTTAGRVVELIQELKTRVGKHYLLVNRADPTSPLTPPLVGEGKGEGLMQVIQKHGLRLLATIPADPTVAEFDAVGRPLVELPAASPVVRAVAAIGDKVLG